MITHAKFEHSCDTPCHSDAAVIWLRRAGDHLQQRAFASTVHADNTHRFALFDDEVRCPSTPISGRAERPAPATATPVTVRNEMVLLVCLADVLYRDTAHVPFHFTV